MSYSNKTAPYTANAFTADPPNGGITPITLSVKLSGFLASSGSFGVSVVVQEGWSKAYIYLYRMYGIFGNVQAFYHTSDNTAVSGVDYTGVSGSVSWTEGDITPRIIEVPILATASITNASFNFHIDSFGFVGALFQTLYVFRGGLLNPYPGPNYSAPGSSGVPVSFPVTILRQGRGTLNFVGTPYSVQRPGGTTTVTLQVQRFSGFKGVVGCSFHTTDGSAVAGVAYTAQTNTLSWANNEGGTKNIVITILNGGSGTQSFTVTIDTPTGGVTIGSVNIATVDIVAAAPPANPTATGSIPDQLMPDVLVADDSDDAVIGYGALVWDGKYFDDPVASFWRNNITFNGILSGEIVGGIIGFGPGTDSYGGGTDFTDGSDSYNPIVNKFQGYVVGGGS